MIRFALTGPSGGGKGFVSLQFGYSGIPCLDTDETVHRLYEDPVFCGRLQAALDADILDSRGSVDRRKLGALVYTDAEKMDTLQKEVYPEVKKKIDDFFRDCEARGCKGAAVDAPQLFEAGFEGDFDVIVCVTAPKEVRLKRVTTRDGIKRKDALLRFAHQMPAREYEKRSTVTLKNSGKEDIAAAVRALLSRYGITYGG